MKQFAAGGYVEPIKQHIAADKPFLGICVGLQALFDSSEEDDSIAGLGLIPGRLTKFKDGDKSVRRLAGTPRHRKTLKAALFVDCVRQASTITSIRMLHRTKRAFLSARAGRLPLVDTETKHMSVPF